MRRRNSRILDRTKETPCVYCGSPATRTNFAIQPVCKQHANLKPKEVYCPECGLPMEVKVGKFGYFWGCKGFPGCEKTYSIYDAVAMA
jgi:predicted amidophosphoribosyltransferase